MNTAQDTVNLTLKAGLVRAVSSSEPIEGFDIVLFERTAGGGHNFLKIVHPGEPSSLFERLFRKDVVAYAVSRNGDLEHEFTHDVQVWDQSGAFTLRCGLSFRVTDPRALLDRLADDPLRRVQREAEILFGQAARELDWSTIEERGLQVEQQILGSKTVTPSGAEVSNQALLTAFAARHGLEIHRVRIVVDLPAEFGEVVRSLREQRNRRVIGEGELHTKNKLELIAARHANVQRILQSSTANLERILTNIADGVSTPAALKSVLGELVETCASFSNWTVDDVGALEAGPRSALGERLLAALPSAGEVCHPAVERIQAVAKVVDALGCARVEKERLLSSACHLVAELTLGSWADPEAVDRHRQEYNASFRDVALALQDPGHQKVLSDLGALHSLYARPEVRVP